MKAAATELGKLRIHSRQSRIDLGWIAATLNNVSLVEFPTTSVPEVKFDRLNEHYREVVTLARLILRHVAIETGRGAVRANGFLMDMNVVFQEFVTRALREELRLADRVFVSDKNLPNTIYLDEGRQIRLAQDVSWWNGRTCVFVGDAKYKLIEDKRAPNADLYQLLAYTTALGLPGGLLIYAAGDANDIVHRVRNAGKRLEIATLNLSGSVEDLQGEIRNLARRVRSLRNEVNRVHKAA